jgi:hypothetical protein
MKKSIALFLNNIKNKENSKRKSQKSKLQLKTVKLIFCHSRPAPFGAGRE